MTRGTNIISVYLAAPIPLKGCRPRGQIQIIPFETSDAGAYRLAAEACRRAKFAMSEAHFLLDSLSLSPRSALREHGLACGVQPRHGAPGRVI